MKNTKLADKDTRPNNTIIMERFLDELEKTETFPKPYPIYANGADEEDDRIDLREIWRIIRKRKWIIMAGVVIVTTLVSVQMFRTKQWYSAATVVEIGRQGGLVLKSGDITLNDDSDPFYLVNVNTKKLALESSALYEDVVKELKLDQNQQMLETVKKKSPLSFFTSEPKSQNGNGLKEYIQQNTKVEQIPSTRALRISFTNENPAFAAEVANKIAEVFMRRSFNSQTEVFRNSADWLDRSTRELKSKVQMAEEDLAKYTRENQIFATDSGVENKSSTLTITKLTQLHDQFIRARTEKILKQSLYEQVQNGKIDELPEAFTDPKIIELRKRASELQTTAAEVKVKFGPSNPRTIEINNQIEAINKEIETTREALASKFRADYERAVKDEQSFQLALNKSKSEAVLENQASIKFNILKQDVDTARSLYTDFLQKTSQANAQIAEQNNNIKVIQEAQPPSKPDGPKRLLIILAGFIASLGGGIVLAYFLERLDETIKTVEDVERHTNLPVLSCIPTLDLVNNSSLKRNKNRRQIDVQKDGSQLGLVKRNAGSNILPEVFEDDSIGAESYLSLRTSLLLSSAERAPKNIMFTSCLPGEGKTTTSINTALSLAKLGCKTLIIDCDLRRPNVHKQLGIDSSVGLTNYLSGNETRLDCLIQDLSIPNLSVLTSGPIAPNPTELLSSKKMREMLEILSEEYDHIIIDTAPIISVTDPVILSTIVDGTVIVVQSGKPTRDMLRRSAQEISAVGSKILGTVLNNVDLRKEGYKHHYYNYYRSDDYANN